MSIRSRRVRRPRGRDDWIEVEIPSGEADYGFIYEIENEQLGEATAFLRIEARDDAPLARPEAADTVLGLSDILGEERIDVAGA